MSRSSVERETGRLNSLKAMASSSAVEMYLRKDGVAVISIQNPPKNTLNNSVMSGLQKHFREAQTRADVNAIVLTGSHQNFSFGVDITLFQYIQKKGSDRDVQFVPAIPFMSMIEDGPKPVVAALEGYAIGAALEMTLACHARLGSSNAKFSIPDFYNGIIPGLGGTQRLPRLMGLQKTLEFFWMTKPWTATEALEAGMIDGIIENGQVVEAACDLALNIFLGKVPWHKSLERVDRLESFGEALNILRRARMQAKRDHPNLMHPLICIDVMEEGVLKGGLAGAMLEEKFSHALVNTPIAKGLMHVFFARRSVSKIRGITHDVMTPRKMSCVAVVGCDIAGASIATSFLLHKLRTIVKANNDDDLQKIISFIKKNIEKCEAQRMISHKQGGKLAGLLSGTTDYKELHAADLIVEAMEEDPQGQREKVLRILANISKPNSILVTNSSLVKLSALSIAQPLHSHIFGVHFMSSAYDNELVEVSFLEGTLPQAVLDVFALLKSMNKVPVTLKCSPGLIVDRLLHVLSLSRLLLIDIGVDKGRIHVLLKDFGMDMNLLQFKVIEDDALLAKSMTFTEGNAILSEHQKLPSLLDDDVLDMLLFPVVNEAFWILHEEVAGSAEHIDICSVLGLGFPSYRGGILFWARMVGMDYIFSQLSLWSNQYKGFLKPLLEQDKSAQFEVRRKFPARL
ncbi:hypothetical protein GOP47_0020837 [Adiantum capillus-veneris]|uniref:enoyl-CoA hydratase n=1 Tax=Adiantum capillus-veneris TaxID=13818 RepID=A0A9D4UAQ2_ADICA|nr:hypothetical protein GOP47_0020837 [Adiantum capillus-veneris]